MANALVAAAAPAAAPSSSSPSASQSDSAFERPWSASNTPLKFASRGPALRQRSLNDLALREWAGPSNSPAPIDDPSFELDESDTLTSLPQIPDTHPEPVTYESADEPHARRTARHSFSNLFTSLEDFRHAASRRLKNKKTSTRKGGSAVQEEDSVEHNSASSWLRSRGTVSRRSRRPSEHATALTAPAEDPVDSQPLHLATQNLQQPAAGGHQNLSPAGGEGARAAAAMARMVEKTKEIEGPQGLALDVTPLLRRMSSVSSDGESGIAVDIRRGSDETLVPDSLVSKHDPADLPIELFTKVLTYLDSETLMQAELVSRRWNETARSKHVWKFAFSREFTEPAKAASGIGGDVPAAGFGLGIKHGYQPWKKMWQVRKQLDQRWKDGHAAAVYLVGHHDSVYCVQFDEEKIVTGSRDWTVRVWDAKTYRCTHVLGIPKDVNTSHHPLDQRKRQGQQPVEAIFPGPHEPPVTVKSDMRHTGSVLCIDYDKELMVTGSSDCSIMVWSIKNGEYRALKQLRAHTMGVLDVRINDKYIVACSKDTLVSVWDRHTLSLVRILNGHRGPVNAVQLRGTFVVSASGDGVAKLWNLATGLCVKEFHPPGDENAGRSRGLACVEFTHDARTIFAGGNDKKVFQFDTASGSMVRTFKGHENLVRSLHYDAANGRIVTGSYDHAVWTYDFATGEPVCSFKNWTTSWMLSARADYRRIVAASQDGKAIIMDFGYNLPGVDLLEYAQRRA